MLPSLNAVQILTQYSSCNGTGCLEVSNQSATWKIYLKNGCLQYVDSSVRELSQLQYFLVKNGWTTASSSLKDISRGLAEPDIDDSPQYREFDQAIAWLWNQRVLSLEQLNLLVKEISEDALETFFWLTSGLSQWRDNAELPAWIQRSIEDGPILDAPSIVQNLHQRLKNWQLFPSEFISPHQRPYLLDFRDIQRPVPNGTLSPQALSQLASLMRRGLSLRQLSLYLKQDELRVAKLLAPYIEEKVIFFRPPNPPFDRLPEILRVNNQKEIEQSPEWEKTIKIICIDDSPTVLSEMKRFLTHDHFEVTAVEDPIKASATIFKLKPDLILMDITMPQINGYRLCSLLRHSSAFDETPIIMVSGNTGLIDKARAKICGATDYLTKPFSQQELLDIVQKHLHTE